MYKYIYIALIGILFMTCSQRPRHVMPKAKMIDVLYDIQLAQAVFNSYDLGFKDLNSRDSLMNSVLDKYNITQLDLDTSLAWYSDNAEEYRKINESVVERLKAERNILSERSNIRKKLSTFDILPTSFRLNKETPVLSFSIDSTKLKNLDMDAFNWKFKVSGLAAGDTTRASIQFSYADTVVRNTVAIDENRLYTFDKPGLPDSLLNRISGYVRLRSRNSTSDILLYDISYLDTVKTATSPAEPVPSGEAGLPAQVEKQK